MEILNNTFQILSLRTTEKLTKSRVENVDLSQKRITIFLTSTRKSAYGSFLPPGAIATKNQITAYCKKLTNRKTEPETRTQTPQRTASMGRAVTGEEGSECKPLFNEHPAKRQRLPWNLLKNSLVYA